MLKKYLLGIDNGGTLIKAALFTADGEQIKKLSAKVPLYSPGDGFTQRKMEDIRNANFSLLRKLTDGLDGEITAVGVCGHGKGLYLLGKDGEFIYDGICSTDSRALGYQMMWERDGTADRVYDKTFQKVLACQPAALLRWLRDNDRSVYDKTAAVLSVKDLIRYFLTGKIFAEYTDVSGTNLLNLTTKKYDDDLLYEFGIPEIAASLPEIAASGQICGYVTSEVAALTGIKEGTPVCGGMFDIDACAVAAGCINAYDMCVITGTWSINEYISPSIVDKHKVSMNSIYCDPAFYLAEESSAVSAGNLDRIASLMGDCDYAEIDRLVENTDPSVMLFYSPFLFASNESPLARASLVGLDVSHTKSDIYRAVFEGVCFSHLTHIERLLAGRSRPEVIRLAGGVANSRIWTQMTADVFGIPLEAVVKTELGAKGAAMAAGIAAGVYENYADAVKKCVKVAQKIQPNGAMNDLYRKKYKKYREINNALCEIWWKK